MAILVCGGAGYIGSHYVRALRERGETPVVLDNLLSGHAASVPADVCLHTGDMRDPALLESVFSRHAVDAVVHFAASSLVGESMERPLEYFHNNVHGMQVLLEAMVRHRVDKIVFSSTASVYGEPERIPIVEDSPLRPASPYGESKLFMERMTAWAGKAHGIRSVILRYFNVAGAWPGGEIGEDHQPESHLIPLVLQVPLGRRRCVTIFGDDWPTPDGTCIRDYLHVMDLVDAHVRAVEYLHGGGSSLVCNLGNGTGFSVRQIVDAASRVTGMPVAVEVGPRRAGDPACLVASAERARQALGWQARAGIEDILASAWAWHQAHPHGFGGRVRR
ncbi:MULTISPECIES: UDP-glucose 4-epimerase GalE [unclassified Desulfovibrio]|uniref:UDP-glucose 4-epimerase GalE n=1 Tax=unclassified Desulfovibrio TaxID=2593640 RepID=UPI000F5FE265|nr:MULTISPECIES: UDP-glucose 4-epimerase GalE [unclassified Desulfovibrio]RRD69647.1 UDP-glucose 4-epimerase GalE [Desulfovibrio sp. OH1209_COT-279]RRD86294.1 UDP-glucose 4-epimerase GalE [Desulfovibrio sp. OH1186_COT-070]